MPREIQQPTTDERGDETHPAFAVAVLHTGITATPGSVLFDSEIRHTHPIVLSIHRATRRRDLNRDWIHQESTPLVKVEMSQAQWAALVSSGGHGSGVPVTLRSTETDLQVPGLPYEPRLALSVQETREAAARAAERVKQAYEALAALGPQAGVKARRAAMQNLEGAINQMPGNVAFAARTLNEHVENVVTKAKADIETMVQQRAQQLGIDAGDLTETLALPGGTEQP